MRALVVHGPRDIRYDTVDDPTPKDLDGAVVQVTQASICGSDLHIYHGHFVRGAGFCVGHEAIGEVVEVGSGVRRYKPGDRVLMPAAVGCATCGPCRRLDIERCENRQSGCYGLTAHLQGSQAEYLRVPGADTNLLTIPEGISDDNALLMTDCLATAWNGARLARITPGDTVVIVGLGPIGIVAISMAFVFGAARVIAVDPVEGRRKVGEAQGAITVDPDGAVDLILSLTKGIGADCVLEYVGAEVTIANAITYAGHRGRVSVMGVNHARSFDYPMAAAQMKSLSFHIGLSEVQPHLPVLTRLLEAGRIDPSVVISHRLGLSEGPRAYEMTDNKEDGVCKIVLDPTR